MLSTSADAGDGATMSANSPRVVRTPTIRPRRGCISGRLHVTLEHLEDPSVDLGRLREHAGGARLVIPEQQFQPVDGPKGALRIVRQVEQAQQLRSTPGADLDGLGRRPPVAAADALEQAVHEV